MRRLSTITEVRDAVAEARRRGQRVGLVPTMGALHAGHLSLVEQVAERAELVVVSIFVNPAQFGPGEDLDAYPRDIEGDEAHLASLARPPDIVFAPAASEVYPRRRVTTVHVAELGDRLCGASRPGHFDGVTTVVAKLLHIVTPDIAIFGRKDFQQLTVIRRMVEDLDLDVEIAAGRTVRELDGLAMSSRNAYLGPEDRIAARALSQGLRAAVLAAREPARATGQATAAFLEQAARRILENESRVTIDYLDVLDPATLESVDGPTPLDLATSSGGEAPGKHGETTRWLVAVAAHVGPARLIDNVVIGDRDDEQALLAATGQDQAPATRDN